MNGAPIFSNNKLITTNLYLWTKGGKILSCGIVKTPAQFCVDDLGGAKYVAGGNPPCVDPAFPCPLPGYYFMGYNGTVAQCSQSPANCNLGQTIVANGSGGTKCFTVP